MKKKRTTKKIDTETKRFVKEKIEAETNMPIQDDEMNKLASESSVLDDFESQLQIGDNASKELFTSKNIRYKTEITSEQRGALSILYDAYRELLSHGIKVSALKQVLDEYIDFGVAVDRKRVGEFVEANKLYNQNQQMNKNNQNQDLQQIKM